MTKSYPSIDVLRDSFNRIYDGADDLQREYELMIESERLGIPLDIYRQLYNLRKEQPIKPYPKPQKWWHTPIDWGTWIYHLPFNEKIILIKKGSFKVIQSSIIITALVALMRYIWEAPKREQQAHYQAWQIINLSRGQTGNGGRTEAIQDLNKDGIDLGKLDASRGALSQINLQNAKLTAANFYNTTVEEAHFENSNLVAATFEDAYLRGTSFKGAIFGCQNGKYCTNFIEAKNITPKQIKEAEHWEEACYSLKFSRKLGLKETKDVEDCNTYKENK